MADSRVTELANSLKGVTAQQIADAATDVQNRKATWQAYYADYERSKSAEINACNELRGAQRRLDALMEAWNRELPRDIR